MIVVSAHLYNILLEYIIGIKIDAILQKNEETAIGSLGTPSQRCNEHFKLFFKRR